MPSAFFFCLPGLRALLSFPTRRSSDLVDPQTRVEVAVLNGLGESPGAAAFHPAGSRLLVASATEGILEVRSEEHTSELQSRRDLVCRLLLEKNNDAAHRLPPSRRALTT